MSWSILSMIAAALNVGIAIWNLRDLHRRHRETMRLRMALFDSERHRVFLKAEVLKLKAEVDRGT